MQVRGPGKEGRAGMGLYKRKGSQFYWMTFQVDGRRIFESTKTSNKKLAEKIYAKRQAEIVEGRFLNSKRLNL